MAGSVASVEALERLLGYAFADKTLLARALTHRSAARDHNERLEFLGDAVVGLVAAELLHARFENLREGPLTRARAALVKRESLAGIARELGLGSHLVLGAGELKSGGRQRDSTLADTFEAIVGAVHLDGGMRASHALVERMLTPRMDSLGASVEKDPKTRLQEHLQGRGLAPPEYIVSAVEGQAHEQTFTVLCSIASPALEVSGEGRSRRHAEQAAAAAALAEVTGG